MFDFYLQKWILVISPCGSRKQSFTPIGRVFASSSSFLMFNFRLEQVEFFLLLTYTLIESSYQSVLKISHLENYIFFDKQNF